MRDSVTDTVILAGAEEEDVRGVDAWFLPAQPEQITQVCRR
jgi:hypothetical protein